MSNTNLAFGQRFNNELQFAAPQLKSMDEYLRTALWNAIYAFLFADFETQVNIFKPTMKRTYKEIWVHILNMPLDEYPNDWQLAKMIKDIFTYEEWTKPYEFIESLYQRKIVTVIESEADPFKYSLAENLNIALKRYNSGYTIVGGKFIPITNQYEIDELQSLMDNAGKFKTSNIQRHFSTAIELLSQKPNPEFRKVIHEAICMVECICRLIEPSALTLGAALNKIKNSEFEIHPALLLAFEKIYGYSSDADGIRHNFKLDEKNELDFEDARFFLIACSAFTNYLIVKANKVGLLSFSEGTTSDLLNLF